MSLQNLVENGGRPRKWGQRQQQWRIWRPHLHCGTWLERSERAYTEISTTIVRTQYMVYVRPLQPETRNTRPPVSNPIYYVTI
jgi:hypothetical protein